MDDYTISGIVKGKVKMSIVFNRYQIKEETYLKAMILSRGIIFSESAMKVSYIEHAKGQNQVYNMPLDAPASRPQELIITNKMDQYSVVVSCVAENKAISPVLLDTEPNGKLIALIDDEKIENIEIHYVKEPEYYSKYLSNGEPVKRYVSACGLDELNIIPWKGCAISKSCRFCGINHFVKKDELSAHNISKNPDIWKKVQPLYLNALREAVSIAKESDCYKEHAHVILIAGNLSNGCLDLETEIFAQIVEQIETIVHDISQEGVVVVISPPHEKKLIDILKHSGVGKVVFNLEAILPENFEKYCPGKADIGYDFFLDRLTYAIEIFGKGNVWTNLVLGLENIEDMLLKCEELIHKGIVISANVLHLDKGNTLDCNVPDPLDVLYFFYKLELLNSKEGFRPFYCSKALRTSLSNEAHDGRITLNVKSD